MSAYPCRTCIGNTPCCWENPATYLRVDGKRAPWDVLLKWPFLKWKHRHILKPEKYPPRRPS